MMLSSSRRAAFGAALCHPATPIGSLRTRQVGPAGWTRSSCVSLQAVSLCRKPRPSGRFPSSGAVVWCVSINALKYRINKQKLASASCPEDRASIVRFPLSAFQNESHPLSAGTYDCGPVAADHHSLDLCDRSFHIGAGSPIAVNSKRECYS